MVEWAKGITKIIMVDDLGDTPAKVNRRTGEMYGSRKHLTRLPKEQVLFIFLHEKAHVELQTTSEYEADAKAFQEYADLGYSLKASVKALTQVLNDKNLEHNYRMYLQLQRAKKYDATHNGNVKILKND
ncbi:hypothetical protein [Pedobacter miscanthi]|uniref:hypothetical protein n=1 Tax=Pedobacter miscanthi TaxID=2259170 RepID=UPI002931378E|nr:hypothetical protein [Pedobacter miscanthi]